MHQGPGPRDARRPGRVHRSLGPHRAAPVRPVDRGPSGDHRDLRPQPDHRHLALRLHVRQATAVGQSAARPHHPAGGRRHHVLERVPRVRGPLRRAARHGRAPARGPLRDATRHRQRHARGRDRQLASRRVRAPRDRSRALFVNDNYTRHFDGWSVADSQPLLDHLYAQFDKPEHTWRHRWTEGDLLIWDNRCAQHSVVGDTDGAVAHCTARPSQEAPRHDRHPLDRQPRRPRRRTSRHLDLAPARQVPRRRPPRGDGTRGYADPRRRHVPRSARDGGARRRLVVLRGPAVLGEAAHRRRGLPPGGDHLRRHHVRRDASRAAGNRRPASRT